MYKKGVGKEGGGAELDAVLAWGQTHRGSADGDPGARDELLDISWCLPILRHVSFSGQRRREREHRAGNGLLHISPPS